VRKFPLCLLIIPCSIKNNYVRTDLCDSGAGVSVMPFSLYKRLDLEKLISTHISLQMANKSTTIPIGICEDVPVQVVNNYLILTDFVVLEMSADDNMSIILGRPFLNTAGADIHFGSREKMNPLSKNIFQNVKKFGIKILHVHLDMLCLYTIF
jgi:hypothetical protein